MKRRLVGSVGEQVLAVPVLAVLAVLAVVVVAVPLVVVVAVPLVVVVAVPLVVVRAAVWVQDHRVGAVSAPWARDRKD
jgi:type IV secretory pathway VirB3-like protein